MKLKIDPGTKKKKKEYVRYFPGSPVAKTLCRRFGLIPSQGTRSHMHI